MHHLYKSKQEEEVTTCVFNVGVFKILKNKKRDELLFLNKKLLKT
jgi:hypothetical protein